MADPVTGAVVGMAGAGLGKALEWAFGPKKKTEADMRIDPTTSDRVTDNRNYLFGGSQQYFNKKRRDLEQGEQAALQREAYRLDYRNAMADRAQAQQIRSQQQQLAGQYQDVLSGKGPESLAQQQMRAGQAQAASQGMGMLASTRGLSPAQMARLSQQQTTAASAQNAQAASMLRAQEIDQARAGMGGLLGNIRGADMQSAAQAAQMEQAQGQLEQGQRGLNDARAMGLLGTQMQMNSSQLGANMAYDSAEAARDRFNAQQKQQAMMASKQAWFGQDAAQTQRDQAFYDSLTKGFLNLGMGAMGAMGGGAPGGGGGGGYSGGGWAPPPPPSTFSASYSGGGSTYNY